MLKPLQIVLVLILTAAYWDAARARPRSSIGRGIRGWYEWGWGFRPGPQSVLIGLVASAVVLTLLAIGAVVTATGAASLLE